MGITGHVKLARLNAARSGMNSVAVGLATGACKVRRCGRSRGPRCGRSLFSTAHTTWWTRGIAKAEHSRHRGASR